MKKRVKFILVYIAAIIKTVCGGGKCKGKNKSFSRYDLYKEDYYIKQEEQYFHLSFDDTIFIFKDLTVNKDKYNSIFDNEILKWMQNLHNETGVKISCYVYFMDNKFSLQNCTTLFRKEFEDNSGWLRFGFHTISSDRTYENANSKDLLEDYNKVIKCLWKIVGEKSIDRVIRLQSFKGSCIGIKSLMLESIEPIVGLLAPDDDRCSYYLDEQESLYLFSHDYYWDKKNEIIFISTDLRTEYIVNIWEKLREIEGKAWNNQRKYMEVFSHEWALDWYNKFKIERICYWALKKKYIFEFTENSIKKIISFENTEK